jgi:heparosan-N-sulfate-glucuronate 5-epimerase
LSPIFCPQLAHDAIECRINGEYSVSCLRQQEQVWLPFSFVHKYFEVQGQFANSPDGSERFDFWHATSKVYQPKADYDPRGVFLFFDNYNVEVRERVKCVSADEGRISFSFFQLFLFFVFSLYLGFA